MNLFYVIAVVMAVAALFSIAENVRGVRVALEEKEREK